VIIYGECLVLFVDSDEVQNLLRGKYNIEMLVC